MRNTITIALIAALACGAARAQQGEPSRPPWQDASPWPDRIVVTLEGDPAKSFSVTWRTDASVESARAEFVEAAPRSRFDTAATSVAAASESVDLRRKQIGGDARRLRWNADLGPVRYHTVTITGLEPDTLYAYRVGGAAGHWSEWMQTRTAPGGDAPLKFLYFGDAQNGILSHFSRVVRAAFRQAPDARFAIHAGDLVNVASRDFEWAEWFEAVGFIHGMIPALPLVGNHEYFDGLRDDDGDMLTSLSLLWRPQFALPTTPGLPAELAETVYATRYGNVLVVALNTMGGRFAEQARWLDAVLESSTADWRIVTMHHPLFELVERDFPGFVPTGPERRELFLPVLRRHGVDLVLQGHDHSYGRGVMPSGSGPAAPRTRRAAGPIVLVTSASGAKMYETREDPWAPYADEGAELQRLAENTQFFQVVEIDGDALTYEAFTATGARYDAFRIERSDDGPNRVVALDTDVTRTRSFESTGEYSEGRFDLVPRRPPGSGR